MTANRRTAIALAVLTLLAGCGGAGGAKEGPPAEDQAAAPAQQPTETQGTETTAAAADPKDTSKKPVIEKPTGSPPSKLQTEDIVKGKGAPVKKGDQISMQYVGVSFSTGQEFDASWERGEPFEFELGGGQVIKGWDKGIVGMRKGGRRRLVIPPEDGYGAAGQPPDIAPNETLIFVVDLVGKS